MGGCRQRDFASVVNKVTFLEVASLLLPLLLMLLMLLLQPS